MSKSYVVHKTCIKYSKNIQQHSIYKIYKKKSKKMNKCTSNICCIRLQHICDLYLFVDVCVIIY